MIKVPLVAASALVVCTVLAAPAYAQPSPTPTPPPGATGLCNDGTYCYSHDRSHACLRHGGVQQWFDTASG